MRGALLTCALALACTARALAGTIMHVVVDDGTSGVAGARVFAQGHDGTSVLLGTSGADGSLDVDAASVTEIFAQVGDRRSAIARAHAGTLHLLLAPPVIATVAARHDPSAPRLVTDASAGAVAMGEPAAALGLVANYRSRAEGGSGRETLNGVPLELPPAPGNTGAAATAIPSDLIDSFSAVQADDGSVTPNYHVLGPSAVTQLRFTAGTERYDGDLLKATLSGTSGRLGYGIVAASGRDDGTLAGQTFADTSGITYDHASHARRADGSLELDYRLGSTQLSLVALGSQSAHDDVAASQPGAIPLGFGPGNRTQTTLATGYVFASQTHGRDSFHALDARFGGGATDDQRDAVLAGVAAGSTSGYRYWGEYDELGFTRRFARDSLTAKASLTRVTTFDFVGADSAAATSLQKTVSLAYDRGDWTDGFGGSVAAVSRNGGLGGTTIEENVHVHRRIAGAAVRLTAYHAQAQTIESTYAGLVTWSSPLSASFVCDAAAATLDGPGNVGTRHPEATTLSASIQREAARGVSLEAGGFLSSIDAMLVQPATQVAPAALPAGYGSALDKIFGAACPGQSHVADVFVQSYVTVPRALAREWYADAKFPVGPLRAEATYETYSAVATTLPPDLAGARTTLIAGAQLPGIPLHRANLVVSYGRRGLLLATALQYVSDNNAVHLPGHATVSAGIQVRGATGTLSLSATNLFGAFGGTLASPRNAVPLPASGGAVPVLAIPEASRWQLRYTTNIGRRSP